MCIAEHVPDPTGSSLLLLSACKQPSRCDASVSLLSVPPTIFVT